MQSGKLNPKFGAIRGHNAITPIEIALCPRNITRNIIFVSQKRKMKKHKTQEHNILCERMCDEFNAARSVKELALIAHLYLEYFVNELVLSEFKNPNLIIDDNDLGTFHGKVTLLKALGLFKEAPHLLANIEIIQRIRNFYAHNLLLSDDVPKPVRDRIMQLQYLENGVMCKFDEAWSDCVDPLLAQLHVCGIATANGLIELQKDEKEA